MIRLDKERGKGGKGVEGNQEKSVGGKRNMKDDEHKLYTLALPPFFLIIFQG